MTKTKRSILHRASALFVIILLALSVMFSLSACGQKKITQDDKADSLFAAEILKSDVNASVKFVAASRGHDIEAEDFEDTDTIDYVDVDAARRILKAAVNQRKFKDSAEKTHMLEYAESLDSTEIESIVSQLDTKYYTEQSAGFFDMPLIWIGKALGWLTSLVGGSYVVAILIFAVLVEILMLPVAIKQQKNSVGMAKLRPQIARIEKKYAGRTDQATLRKKQEEIMTLQQKEGFSPFSGCLPMLIQLIIVGFILYPIIQNPLRYVLNTSVDFSNALMTYATAPRAAGGLGITLSNNRNVIEMVSILKEMNIEGIKSFPLIFNGEEIFDTFAALPEINFKLFGLEIGRVPKIIDILVLVPILNVVLQWVSMKLTRKWAVTGAPTPAQDAQTQASMKIMDLVFPLMTLFIMFQVPALIGIYWLFRSLLSLLKSFIMKTVMPVPKYTDEEIREMEKAQKAAEKAQKEALKEQPKFRSLHYIDEDDYDELPTMKNKDNNKNKYKNNGDIPDIKD